MTSTTATSTSGRRRRRRSDRAVIAVAALALLGLLAPVFGLIPGGVSLHAIVPHGDVIVHVFVYAAIAVAVVRLTSWWALPVVLVAALLEEAAQSLDPSRQISWLDAAANVVGVMVVAPLVLMALARLDRGGG